MGSIGLEGVKERLQRRRRLILESSLRAVSNIEQMRGAERDPEVEEGSQSEQEQSKLSQLAEVEQREIAQIDAALERIEAGRYGACAECGDPIDPRRLEALPFALDCAECGTSREEARRIELQMEKPSRW